MKAPFTEYNQLRPTISLFLLWWEGSYMVTVSKQRPALLDSGHHQVCLSGCWLSRCQMGLWHTLRQYSAGSSSLFEMCSRASWHQPAEVRHIIGTMCSSTIRVESGDLAAAPWAVQESTWFLFGDGETHIIRPCGISTFNVCYILLISRGKLRLVHVNGRMMYGAYGTIKHHDSGGTSVNLCEVVVGCCENVNTNTKSCVKSKLKSFCWFPISKGK